MRGADGVVEGELREVRHDLGGVLLEEVDLESDEEAEGVRLELLAEGEEGLDVVGEAMGGHGPVLDEAVGSADPVVGDAEDGESGVAGGADHDGHLLLAVAPDGVVMEGGGGA